MVLDTYDSGANSELVASMQILNSNPITYQIYTVEVPNVKTGQVLVAFSECEFTNPFSYNVGVFSQIICSSQSGATSGTLVSGSNGRNVTVDTHHDTHVHVGMYLPTNQTPQTVYFSLTADATASLAGGSDFLTVEPNYGRLRVLRFP